MLKKCTQQGLKSELLLPSSINVIREQLLCKSLTIHQRSYCCIPHWTLLHTFSESLQHPSLSILTSILLGIKQCLVISKQYLPVSGMCFSRPTAKSSCCFSSFVVQSHTYRMTVVMFFNTSVVSGLCL